MCVIDQINARESSIVGYTVHVTVYVSGYTQVCRVPLVRARAGRVVVHFTVLRKPFKV